MGLQSSLAKKFISRAVWLPQDWQREFDKWIKEISMLLISHNRKNFSDAEWQILNPIQDEARQAKRQNNMLGYRAALRRYGDSARLILVATEAPASGPTDGGLPNGQAGVSSRLGGNLATTSEIDEA